MAFPSYVDISSFQPASVDWAAYVPWSKQVDGIARLAVRASEGTGVGDANYKGYVSGIRAVDPNSLLFHYHYAYPQFNSPQAEVDWMSTQLAGLNPQDIIMLDYEEIDPAANASWALAWLQYAQQKFGRVPWIYAGLSYIQARLQNPALAAYPLILAAWTGTLPSTPAPWKTASAWQYTDSLSTVPGFGGVAVDADFYLVPPKPLFRGSNGTIISLQKSYQLMNPAESQDQCGPWTASELKYAGLPGQAPLGNVDQVHQWAVQEYTTYLGPDVTSNQNGSSIDNMHSFFSDSGYHWWDIGAISATSTGNHDNAEVIAALKAGYPVVVTVNEQSVIRPDGSNPYPWQPALGPVNHIFCIVGYTSDGYFLVDDELNAEDNSWPDKYSQAHLEIHWASIIGLVGPDPSHPWLAPIPSGDPLSWPPEFNAQNFTGEFTMGVPQGWTDNGSALTAPNGFQVVLGFRDHVLNYPGGWNKDNWPMTPEFHADPLEYSNPGLGAGQKQPFKWITLEWTSARGVFEAYQGEEIWTLLQKFLTDQAQISSLQAQLAACQANVGGVPPSLQAAINQAETELQNLASAVSILVSQIQPFVK